MGKSKKHSWLFYVALLAIALTSFLIFNFIIQLRFLIHDELQIRIDPLQSIIQTNSNKVALNFTVDVKKFKFCNSVCQLELVDPYTEKIIDKRAIELKNKITQGYLVDLKMNKTGERVLYFYVTCHNEKSFLCKTYEADKLRSALVTINRDYTSDENRTKEATFEKLKQKFIEIKKSEWEEREYNRAISVIKKNLTTNLSFTNSTMGLDNKFNLALQTYLLQNFEEANSRLNFSINHTNLTALITKISQYNRTIEFLTNNSEKIQEAFNYYCRINDSRAENFNFTKLSFEELAHLNITQISNQLNQTFLEKNETENNLWNFIETREKELNLSLNGSLCENLESLKKSDNQTNETNLSYCSPCEKLNLNFSAISFTPSRFIKSQFPKIEPKRFCCIYDACSFCETRANNYPIIFVHGHALNKADPPESSIDSFALMQKKMADDGLIVNAGDIDYRSVGKGLWSEMKEPVGVRVTYYYTSYYDANSLRKAIAKDEGIENYAIRLKELINFVLKQTGANKVILVTHSMGGLVAREYLMLFGEDKVDKVIMVAPPNHGISGRVAQFCGYLGNKRACDDMTEGSIFLKKLNEYKPRVPITIILGSGCDVDGKDGDGIVTVESGKLPYAKVELVKASCKGALGAKTHSYLVYPNRYPQVYKEITAELFNKTIS